MTMHRILFVTSRYPPVIAGGGEISLQILAESLQKNGHAVCVITCDASPVENVNGIQTIRLGLHTDSPAIDVKKAFLKVVELSKEYDILHCYNLGFGGFQPNIFDLLATGHRAFSCPLFAHLNHPSIYFKDLVTPSPLKRLYRRLEQRLCIARLQKYNQYVALSEYLKAHYVKRGLAADKISVVPNMLPDIFFRPMSHEPATPALLYLGNLGVHKGVGDLVSAMGVLSTQFPTLQLRLVGWGEPEVIAKLRQTIDVLGLQKVVKVYDPLPHAQLLDAYDESTIVVHPGHWAEPFGRTIIEAMARARPVVVSRAGEPPLLVDNEILIFEAGDWKALGQKIADLLSNQQLRSSIGAELRSKAQRFSIKSVLPYIEALYEIYPARPEEKTVSPPTEQGFTDA